LNPNDKIFENFEEQNFSLKKFFTKNIRGILGTLMVHMFLLIVFLLIKIQGFKRDVIVELNVDYVQEIIEQPKAEYPLTPAEQAYLERIMAQSNPSSNRASNISENLEKEISTESFVDEYLKQLNEERSEDWKEQQDEINKRLQQPDYVAPVEARREIEMDDYTGPSNISYEFLEAPFSRFKTYLPVPVYKCQGAGIVTVNIEVDQSGRVISASPSVSSNFPDEDCLLDVARTYAYKTRFQSNLSAPKSHKGKIIYNFIPQ
jgi:hypothetical protein